MFGRWHPQFIVRAIDSRQSSTEVVIVETDIGRGFLKAVGNPAGTHALASELVATQLAEWLGLPTLDYGLIRIDEELDSIRLYSGGLARTGTGFITRWENGDVWDGSAKQLRRISNPEAISRLVVFDTWVMNRDRKSRLMAVTDNVFLRATPEQIQLIAIDHTHCFAANDDGKVDFHRKKTLPQSTEVFGLFTEFRDFLDRSVVRSAADRLKTLETATVASIVKTIPKDWNVGPAARKRLVELILNRARETAETIEDRILGPLFRQPTLMLSDSEKTS